ncbi:MAG: Rnase Y domain-containing protein, partial [Candidatus Nitrotoga sp.]
MNRVFVYHTTTMLDTEVVGGISIIKMVYYGAASGVFGIILGYVLRWAMTAGKRGSIEIEVKQLLLTAKEDAQKITQDAEKKAERKLEELRAQEKEKEREWRKTEDRLVKKEETLDKRQEDVDREVESLKGK